MQIAAFFFSALGFAGAYSPSPDRYAVKERHVVPPRWNDVGQPSANEKISLQIGLEQSNFIELERQLFEISDPDHERYGQYLSKQETANLVQPTADAFNAVENWLRGSGIEAWATSEAQDWLFIELELEAAEVLLQTKYTIYEHEDGTRLTRTPEWSVPLHLHDHISTIQPTTAFLRADPLGTKSNIRKRDEHYKVLTGDFSQTNPPPETATGIKSVCNFTRVTPDCLRTLYDTIDYVPQVPDMQKIGFNDFLGETSNRSDTKIFLQKFRPDAVSAAYSFEQVSIAGGTIQQTPNYTTGLEGNLDIQMITSLAYPIPAVAYSTGGSPPFNPDKASGLSNANEPYLTWVQWALQQDTANLPSVISTSYGDDEQTVPSSYAKAVCSAFAQLGARGITLVFSSGDFGVGPDGKCTSTSSNKTTFLPVFPASCPYVTAVGGTKGYPEVVLTDSINGVSSGGGFSNYFARPAYQNSAVLSYVSSLDPALAPYYNQSGRAYPDIAAQSYHILNVWNATLIGGDGTSFAAPIVSSIFSLVNDALLAKGKPVLGFLNPWLYKKGYQAFIDVVEGSSLGCNETGLSGFPAKVGWDAASGFGTPSFSRIKELALISHASRPPR